MQFTTIITALFLATTAVACPNGPYRTGSSCDQTCAGAQRCGDDNYVIQCVNNVWTRKQHCEHCKFGACA
ncbi:hypothetical protein PtrSN002B_007316 [Pyrenophora tritici-repentis]|uniref:SBP domain containing protein n=2 Tax=Pyrenophora tritici-repentis TaxID=45151 RepID=A0A2W1FIM0_9PLEO|nr:uncharacterized protein PTRG_11876 [Pyrenophora tritici-repentis Pt-1C-BFP]KAA8615321.1 hypothetical protein PtrV1_10717 [Pyrenophora tritici-repentis]EDU46032.1 hypothetical protein PTRG_11876 [Pyrenophora tritici-repentis Pt-1C-BFP]KAF7444097.1 hypothetical protein A1F99_121710 [Pyrenophora tritici-repentis]KAF7566162.1 SBP domain containing protein [Pyrenophora tritici-repentis]KAG9379836.1 hypothetical protein A1F94_010192 [Pyrenophora tritici-repentis]